MFYTLRNRDDLKSLWTLTSLEEQVKDQRSKEKLGQQKISSQIREVFEPTTDTDKSTSMAKKATIRTGKTGKLV